MIRGMAPSEPRETAQVSRTPGWLRELVPWLGLAFLWLLYELPRSLTPGNWQPGVMRPTLDVLVLLTLWGASHSLSHGRVLRRVLGVIATLLVLFRLDEMIFTQLM